MKRRILGLFVALSCFVLFAAQDLHAATNDLTLQYLKNQTRDAWIVMALSANNVSGLDASQVTVDGLNAATDIERAILGVAAAGANPYDVRGHNLVTELDSRVNNNQIGDQWLVNDDIFGILAYRVSRVAYDDSRITNSKSFILSQQNSDGGFPFASGQPSDTNITAMAISALFQAGMTNNDLSIQKAFNYLLSAQNNDGGFGYAVNTESDTASTAWIMNATRAAGRDVLALTRNGGYTPYTFLNSMAMSDGSYKWKKSDQQGSPMMTAYAAIALSNATYPIGGSAIVVSKPAQPTPTTVQPSPTPVVQPQTKPVQPPQQQPAKSTAVSIRYRVEGRNKQICQGETKATTALDALKKASEICRFNLSMDQTSMGAYVRQVADDAAQGADGWLYTVNFFQPQVAADAYKLKANDYVTWYYGRFDWQPMKLIVKRQQGRTIELVAQRFDGTAWHGVPDATVTIDGKNYLVDKNGWIKLTLSSGTHKAAASKRSFIRSHVITLTTTGAAVEAAARVPTVYYRIEGGNKQYCQGTVQAQNPFEAMTVGAVKCGVSYSIVYDPKGPIVEYVGDDIAAGTMKWRYLINWMPPKQGFTMLNQTLKDGDYVTWYVAEQEEEPLWLSFDVDAQWAMVRALDHETGVWKPLQYAAVRFGDVVYPTNSRGMVTEIPLRTEIHTLYAEKDGYVRSHLYFENY